MTSFRHPNLQKEANHLRTRADSPGVLTLACKLNVHVLPVAGEQEEEGLSVRHFHSVCTTLNIYSMNPGFLLCKLGLIVPILQSCCKINSGHRANRPMQVPEHSKKGGIFLISFFVYNGEYCFQQLGKKLLTVKFHPDIKVNRYKIPK